MSKWTLAVESCVVQGPTAYKNKSLRIFNFSFEVYILLPSGPMHAPTPNTTKGVGRPPEPPLQSDPGFIPTLFWLA